MTNQAVRLKLRQTQQLNQQQQQSLRILHMSAQELSSEVDNWLQDNPLLERVESDAAEQMPEIRYSAALPSSRRISDEESDIWETVSEEIGFHRQLHEQVCEHPLNEDEARLVHLLIDCLDEQGYLKESLQDIIDHAPLEWMLDEDELADALQKLKSFDPAGVGAADLAEALLLQLARHEPNETVFCAVKLIQNHLADIGKTAIAAQIRKHLPQYSVATIEAAQQLIASLNPFPAYGNSDQNHTEYVEPEVWIRPDNETGQWKTGLLKPPQTNIRLNTEYSELLTESNIEAPELKQKLTEAKTLLFSLEQRKNTVHRIADLILEKQADFFEFGAIGLVPLTIKDAAAELGLAESTVSRAVNQKYLACPQGIFPLRYFFSQAATYADSEDEQGISAHAVKALMESLLHAEDKARPLSDQAIAEQLALSGMNLARRTVAKYREEMNFPPAHQRRRRSGG